MPPKPTSGLSADNILEGGRKRIKLIDGSAADNSADGDVSASSGPGASSSAVHDVKKTFKQGKQMLEALLNAVDPDQFLIAEPFLRLPPAELYPDYYQVIKRPISFEQILDRLHAEEYKTLDEVRQDCETVCNNAKRYNQRDSTIWVLAKRLHSLVKDVYVALLEDGKVSESLKGTVIAIDPSDPEAVRSFGLEVSEGEEDAGMEDSSTAIADQSTGPKAVVKRGKGRPRGSKGKAKATQDTSAAAQEETLEAAPAKRTKITIKRHKPATGPDADTSVESVAGGSTSAGGGASAASVPEASATTTVVPSEKSKGKGRAGQASPSVPAQDRTEDRKQEGDALSAPARAGSTSTPKQLTTALPGSPKGTPLYPPQASGSAASAFGYSQYTPGETSYQATPPAVADGKFRGKYLKVALKTWLKSIKDLTRPDGSSVVEFFLQLPNRTDYPDYYKVIKDPISISEIEAKLQSKHFVNGYLLNRDLKQMLENAQFYNEEGSLVWVDAQRIKHHIENKAIPLFVSEGFTLNEDDVRNSAVPGVPTGELGVVRHGDAKGKESSENKLKLRLQRVQQERGIFTPGKARHSQLSPTSFMPPNMQSPSKLPLQYQMPIPPPMVARPGKAISPAMQHPVASTPMRHNSGPQQHVQNPFAQAVMSQQQGATPMNYQNMPYSPGFHMPPHMQSGQRPPMYPSPQSFQMPSGPGTPMSFPNTSFYGQPGTPGMAPGFSLPQYGAGPSGLANALSMTSPAQSSPGKMAVPGGTVDLSTRNQQDERPAEPERKTASFFAAQINPVRPWNLDGIVRPHVIPLFLIEVQWRPVGSPHTLDEDAEGIVRETIVVDSTKIKQHLIRIRKGPHIATRKRKLGEMEINTVKVRFVLREFDDPNASKKKNTRQLNGRVDEDGDQHMNDDDAGNSDGKVDFLVNVLQDGAQIGKLRRSVIGGADTQGEGEIEDEGVQKSWASIIFEPKLKVGLNTLDIDVDPPPPSEELEALIGDRSAPQELRDRAKVLKALKERYRLFLYV